MTNGNRAIQQLVISFDHNYLIETGVISRDTSVLTKGDYVGQYDDILLRHAIRSGVQDLIDHEGYRDAKMIAALQDDTTHLHAHVVIYESSELARKRGKEERGVIKDSSFSKLSDGIHLVLDKHKKLTVTPQKLSIQRSERELSFDHVDDVNLFNAYHNVLARLEWLRQLEEQEEKAKALLKELYPDKDVLDEEKDLQL